MSRKGRARKTHNRAATKQTFQNTILRGVGGETLQDRSAHSSAASSLHPYFNNNFIARWREYVQLYMTSWEARKIVDIPIQDALREPVTIHGLSEIDLKKLMDGYEALNAEKQLRRALIQERLLGGALILPVLARGKDEDTDSQLSTVTILPGDLKTFNVIDISKLGRGEYEDDCFSPEYDQIKTLHINGTIVHASRLLIFDGAPLFNFSGQRVMENFRFNPVGMGESVLSTLYDTITRAIGTQQGAYHLVNLASCIVLACAELRSLSATNSPARAKLDEMAEQLSMYRAAIVDAKDVEFKQYSSNFGAVPELIMSFLQILAAGAQ